VTDKNTELLFEFAAGIKSRSRALPGNAYPEALLDPEFCGVASLASDFFPGFQPSGHTVHVSAC